MHQSRRPPQRGVSLLETALVLFVVMVTLGAGLPGLLKLQDRKRLEGAAAQLETELQYARSQAVASQRSVRFSWQADAVKSCYVIHTGSPGDCRCDTAATVCRQGAEELRTVRYGAGSRIRATSNSASFLFDPVRGTVTPTATLSLSDPQGDSVRLIVSIMGRVRSCSPTGLPGHRPC